MMDIHNVTIAGGGTLGSQISWQTAYNGFDVIVYDALDEGIEQCKKFHQMYAELFKSERGANKEDIDITLSRIKYTTNLKEALSNCDLLSESIPENLEIKQEFWKKASELVPDRTVLTTNSSTLTPSQIVNSVSSPSNFLALHFANGIWDANIGEVMGHPETSKEYFNKTVAFAEAIGMVPIKIYKEQNGYVVNSILVPFLISSLDLLYRKISTPEDVDRTWMIATQSKHGPCSLIDMIGMTTVYNVLKMLGDNEKDQYKLDLANWIKTDYIDKNKMGVKTGEGFYKYPNPHYKEIDFLGVSNMSKHAVH